MLGGLWSEVVVTLAVVGLFKTRQEQAQLAAREAAGESFWTSEFDEAARNKIVLAMRDADGHWGRYSSETPFDRTAWLLARDRGWTWLEETNTQQAVEGLVLKREDHEIVATVIEAYVRVATFMATGIDTKEAPGLFVATVSRVLSEHRIAYDLIDGTMVPFDSKEMHEAVVAPTLRLLAGRQDWAEVESAYQDALGEIADGKPADAITDAGRALQAALEASGARGNALGPLIKDAKKQGLLGPHDTNLTSGIESLMHWVSAERSEMGEAHKAGTDERADAWLAVHVVGALILRLGEGLRT